MQVEAVDRADAVLAELDTRIRAELANYQRPLRLLQTIPGIDLCSACTIRTSRPTRKAAGSRRPTRSHTLRVPCTRGAFRSQVTGHAFLRQTCRHDAAGVLPGRSEAVRALAFAPDVVLQSAAGIQALEHSTRLHWGAAVQVPELSRIVEYVEELEQREGEATDEETVQDRVRPAQVAADPPGAGGRAGEGGPHPGPRRSLSAHARDGNSTCCGPPPGSL